MNGSSTFRAALLALVVAVLLAPAVPAASSVSHAASLAPSGPRDGTGSVGTTAFAAPASHAPALGGGAPAIVARTILPNYNGSLAGNFPASVANLKVGAPAYLPTSGTYWWPELPVATNATPRPPTGPAVAYATSTGSVLGIVPGAANASAFLYDAANGLVYAADPLNDSVAVLDPVRGTAVGRSIPVGGGPDALALDNSTGELFVANALTDNVTVVDTATNEVTVAGIPVGNSPVDLAVDVTDGWLYAANANSSYLTAIDLGSANFLTTEVVLVNGPAVSLAYSPLVGELAAVSPSSVNLTIVDASSTGVDSRYVTVGTGCMSVVTAPNGTAFLVAASASQGLEIVSATPPLFSVDPTPIPTDPAPTVVTVVPGGSDVVVWSATERTLVELNASSGSVLHRTRPLTSAPGPLAYDPALSVLFSADGSGPEIARLDASTGRSLGPSIPLNATPTALAVAPSGSVLYAGFDGGVDAFAASTGALLATAPLPGPNGPFVVDPRYGNLWVGRPDDHDLVALNLTDLSVVRSTGNVSVDAGAPSSATYDPATAMLFVVNVSDQGSVRPIWARNGSFAGPDVYLVPNVTSVAYDAADDLVYGAGDSLAALDPSSLDVVLRGAGLGPHTAVTSLAVDPVRAEVVARTIDGSLGASLAAVDGSSAPAANASLVLVPLGLGNGSLALVPAPNGSASLAGSGGYVASNTGSGTVSVLASPLAIASFGFVPSAVDVNATTVTSVVLSGGSGPIVVGFTGLPPGCVSSSTVALACAPTAAGTYPVEVVATDALGESASARATLVVGSVLAVRASTGPPTTSQVDVGVSLPFDAVAAGGTGGYVYSWSFGDGSTAVGAAVHHAFASPGLYAVRATVTDAGGGRATDALAITAVAAPTIRLFAPPATDVGVELALSARVSGGTGPGVVSWSFGDHASATGANVTHAWSRPGNYTVNASYVDVFGVETGASLTVRVNASLAATFRSEPLSAEVAVGTDVAFVAGPENGTPAYTAVWSFGDGTGATGLEVGHAYARPGNYTVNVTLTDAAGVAVRGSLLVLVGAAAGPSAGWLGGGSPALVLGLLVGATVAATVLYAAERSKHRRPLRPPTPFPPPTEPPGEA